jgi:hypothetical protein
MSQLANCLSEMTIPLDNILLDPNNPRFSDLGDDFRVVQTSRFNEDRVQGHTMEKMKADSFHVAELRDTIKELGFLPMDRIVVQKWEFSTEEAPKYIVIEGNRRVTALKWLISLNETGRESFSTEQLDNFANIDCLLIDKDNAPKAAELILPGLRHVSGIREWGPYQKAKAIYELRTSGYSAQEAAQSLGLKTLKANRAYRCYLALESMKQDEEFGECASPKLYSYFEEIIKKPVLRTWLGWSDSNESFENLNNLHEFYSWIVPNEDDESVKISMAIHVRELASIIADEDSMSILRSPSGTLTRALANYEVEHPQSWLPKIGSATKALRALSTEVVRTLPDDSLEKLEELRLQIESTIRDRRLLISGEE